MVEVEVENVDGEWSRGRAAILGRRCQPGAGEVNTGGILSERGEFLKTRELLSRLDDDCWILDFRSYCDEESPDESYPSCIKTPTIAQATARGFLF